MLIAIGGATWRLWRERVKSEKGAYDQRQRQHEENQAKLNAILYDQLYLVPHDHIESRIPGDENVALTRGGIIRRPGNGGTQLKRGGTP